MSRSATAPSTREVSGRRSRRPPASATRPPSGVGARVASGPSSSRARSVSAATTSGSVAARARTAAADRGHQRVVRRPAGAQLDRACLAQHPGVFGGRQDGRVRRGLCPSPVQQLSCLSVGEGELLGDLQVGLGEHRVGLGLRDPQQGVAHRSQLGVDVAVRPGHGGITTVRRSPTGVAASASAAAGVRMTTATSPARVVQAARTASGSVAWTDLGAGQGESLDPGLLPDHRDARHRAHALPTRMMETMRP